MNRLNFNDRRSSLRFKRINARSVMSQYETGQIKNNDNVLNLYEGLFGKSLSHDINGLPTESEIIKLKEALNSGLQSDFDSLVLGGSRKLANPQASLGFEVIGPDLSTFTMPPPPTMGSKESASEMIEVYEMALLRNISFDDIENEIGTGVIRAISSINDFGDSYTGVKIGGVVNGKSLFRSNLDGFDKGPYVSQLLYKPLNFGPHPITQKYGVDQGVYGITFNNWLEIQKGNVPVTQQPLTTSKYINNGQVLSSLVHNDFVYQLFLYGGLILQESGVPKNPGFANLLNEGSFVTNGGVADWSTALARLSHNALSASWDQKWRNHLRLRPETFAGRVVSDQDNGTSYVHPDIFTDGINTINAVKNFNLSNGGDNKPFLPLVYAEGSPTHPSYPAGHAVISGALTTLLKLFFDGSQSISMLGSVEHSIDGDSLVGYSGVTSGMTIGTELNKLAHNVARGRDIAGVHYLNDGFEGMLLGEKIAICFFKENISQYHVNVGGFTLKKFDGSTMTI